MTVGMIDVGVLAVVQLASVGRQADVLFVENLATETATGILRRDILLMREQILQYPLAPAERRGEVSASAEEISAQVQQVVAAFKLDDASGAGHATVRRTERLQEPEPAPEYAGRGNGHRESAL